MEFPFGKNFWSRLIVEFGDFTLSAKQAKLQLYSLLKESMQA